MTEDSPVFIDTNVLVYYEIIEAPLHIVARRTLDEYSTRETACWISRQVPREFIATLTRPQTFTQPLHIGIVLERAAHFEHRFQIAEDGPSVTRNLHDLLRQVPCGGKQVHDANIVATMLAHGIPRILTHNLADFTRFEDVIGVLPLEEQTHVP